MKIEKSRITSVEKISAQTYSLKFSSDYFSKNTKPGQFFNIKVFDGDQFFLRRPFSISQIELDFLEIVLNVVGKGTEYLSNKCVGDELNVMGPLGNGFNMNGDYDTAILVGGGIGIAPFPFLIKRLVEIHKKYILLMGFKSKKEIIDLPYESIKSTDDGSEGFKGNVIELLESQKIQKTSSKLKIFGCGPNVMLKSLARFSSIYNISTEVSMESNMACGFGICQGCPVEAKNRSNKYFLICKDGPCFDINQINL